MSEAACELGEAAEAFQGADAGEVIPAEQPAAVEEWGEADRLAAYDAETVRLVIEQEAKCGEADAEHDRLKSAASTAKKLAEAETEELRKMIRDRKDGRGKSPERTLLNYGAGEVTEPAAPNDEWRAFGLGCINLTDEARKAIASFMVDTLGELHDEVQAGQTFGLPLGTVSDIRGELELILDKAAKEAEAKAARHADPELWRQFPIERWTRFGLTAKDVEKMAAGEVKRETGRRPIVTVGDLSDFSKPTAGGYSRGYADIKGIGPGGADRISEAETKFWAWWGEKGEAEFARERGLSGGNEAVAGTGIEGDGGGDPG